MRLFQPCLDTATETMTDLLQVECVHRSRLALMSHLLVASDAYLPNHCEFICRATVNKFLSVK